jgi:hypothetical protein
MTVKEAREILQEEISDLTDNQVIDLIRQVGGICDGILDIFIVDRQVNI